MDDLTISEFFFEQFCKDNSIPYSRIERKQHKTPDYNVYFGEHHIIAEVKQFDASEKDKKLREKVRSCGAASGMDKSGRRVRKKIGSAKKQLEYKECPAILVVFDNVPIGSVDADDIKTAMYGHETISLSFSENREGSSVEVEKVGFGPERKFRQDCNTNFSAIALLYKFEDSLRLSIFHNIHAKYPFDPSWTRCNMVRHFTLGPQLPGAFQEWQEIYSTPTN